MVEIAVVDIAAVDSDFAEDTAAGIADSAVADTEGTY